MNISVIRLFLVTSDVLTVSFCIYASYWLRFDGKGLDAYMDAIAYQIPVAVLIRVLMNQLFSLYRSIWTFASISEMIRVVNSVVTGSLLVWLVLAMTPDSSMPRSVMLISTLLTIASVGGVRFGIRFYRDYRRRMKAGDTRRVLVVGAGAAGAITARELRKDYDDRIAVAFVDDDANKRGMLVNGIPVRGGRLDIPGIVTDMGIDEIIIALPSAPKKQIRGILEICQTTGKPTRILPGVYELISGEVQVNKVRDIDIEDLLGRDAVKLDLKGIAGYLEGEVVLVTGAGGSIGSELCRQISRFNPKHLVLLGRGENSIYEIDMELSSRYPNLRKSAIIADVRDKDRLREVFADFRPTVVFHAAAHKHVPLMEAAPVEAVKNNVFGTRNVARMAHEFKAKRFVLISTDKAVNPTSVMGASKRFAELVIQQLAQISTTKYCAVRFGNVLGSRGSVVPLFKKQIAKGGPVTVTDPAMTRFFMTIPEAVSLVIQAGSMGARGEIFVLDMGEPVKINDLATQLIRLSGFEPGVDIPIVYSGLRPGEKLFEELFTSEEGTTATQHERIFMANAGGDAARRLDSDMVGNGPLTLVKRLFDELDVDAGIDVDVLVTAKNA